MRREEKSGRERRRRFLVALAAAAGLPAALGAARALPRAPAGEPRARAAGYRLTPHVRKFYDSAGRL